MAERVRLHLMDSGVRVCAESGLNVRFTARIQRSDAPSAKPEELLRRVREALEAQATERGYEETAAESVEVKDPVDDTRVLDVWHEVTYSKAVDGVDPAVEEVSWALSLDKYVRP